MKLQKHFKIKENLLKKIQENINAKFLSKHISSLLEEYKFDENDFLNEVTDKNLIYSQNIKTLKEELEKTRKKFTEEGIEVSYRDILREFKKDNEINTLNAEKEKRFIKIFLPNYLKTLDVKKKADEVKRMEKSVFLSERAFEKLKEIKKELKNKGVSLTYSEILEAILNNKFKK